MAPALRQLITAAALALSAGVHADCVDTISLRYSPQQQEFRARAVAALQTFLRPAPSGEGIRWSDKATDPNLRHDVCEKGDRAKIKFDDWAVEVSREFIWPDPQKSKADTVVTLTLSINQSDFTKHTGPYAGAYGTPQPGGNLKFNNVTWAVISSGWSPKQSGDALRDSVIAALDRQRLEKLISQPLPTVNASKAMAANPAQPFQLVAAPPPPAPAPTAAPVNTAVTPSAPPAAPAPASPAPTDTLRGVTDTVNTLRGIFGR